MNKNTTTLKTWNFIQILLILSLIFIVNCARVIAPKGGPKDKTPPVVIESDPENHSVNFNEKKFTITFDEYIQLKNVNRELLISPPIIEKPVVLLKSKSMIIKFEEDIPDSTTVNFNFYNAIADYNEGNIYMNYQYIFSTGNIIDTLFVHGIVLNAFDHEPIQDALIMFYKNTADTVPQTILPSFISKSNKEGKFVMSNIPEGKYKVFALSDGNYNKLFDLPTETIAYLDTLISPAVELFIQTDTITEDSIVTTELIISKLDTLQLYMFEEENPIQYLDKKKRDEKGRRLTFFFTETLAEALKINLLDTIVSGTWFLLEENDSRDTLVYWISDTTLAKKDTLSLSLEYIKYDSVGDPFFGIDTIRLTFDKKIKEKKEKGGLLSRLRQEEKDTIVISELKLKYNVVNSTLGLEKDLIIIPKYPVERLEPNKIKLFYMEDTIETLIDFEFMQDSLKLRNYRIRSTFEESEKYKILIDTAAFTDIYGNKNDTLEFRFSVQKENFYGSIIIKLSGVQKKSFIQLLNKKGNVLREYPVNAETKILNINLLSPGKYKLKLIVDFNENGVWDTGNYIEKIQPEKVYFFDEVLIIKSGWDNDISWEIE